jgi:glutathione peroxidase
LKYVRPGGGYVPAFPLMGKIDVNGADQHPLYTWLKSSCGVPSTSFVSAEYISWDPVFTTDITWNFEMFLIDAHGVPFRRYSPDNEPITLMNDIQYLLGQI